MKFDYTKLSFYSALGQSEEFIDYEFMDDDNLQYSVIVTYDTSDETWCGIAEVLDDVTNDFVHLCDITEEQVNHCRELIPPVHLPKGQ